VIGKQVAIKVIADELCTDPDSVGRFVQEARAAAQLGHPNIVDAFAFGTLPDGRAYFVMEWLRGQNLLERLLRGPGGLDQALEIVDQVCAALEAAHARGIIHRDLKPDNVYLTDLAGRLLVKLLDFGIAKLAADGEQEMTNTRTGTLMGTPFYCSPEQARGRR